MTRHDDRVDGLRRAAAAATLGFAITLAADDSGAQVADPPPKPTLAMRTAESDSEPATAEQTLQGVLADLNHLIRDFRQRVGSVQPTEAEADYELGGLKLRLFQKTRYRLAFVLTIGQDTQRSTVQVPLGAEAALHLFSSLLDQSLFDPLRGLYRALPVQRLTFDPLDTNRVIADVELPANWDGYEPELAMFGLSEQRAAPASVCERVTGMKLDYVVQPPTKDNPRIARLRFELNSPNDRPAVLDLLSAAHVKLVLVAHYYESPKDTSNAAFIRPAGVGPRC